MEIKDRIYQLIAVLKLKPATFEKALGLSNSYLRNVKNVAADTCRKIVETFPNVSLQWLICGEGDMFNNSSQGGLTQTNRDITNDIHGDGSIEVLNIGENADVDSPKNVRSAPSGDKEVPNFEEMAKHFCRRTSRLQEELKQRDNEIEILNAKLEEREKTIEILTRILSSSK